MAKKIDLNGFWTCGDCNLTKVGVFPYMGRDISPELDPDKVYFVYRPADELFSEQTLETVKDDIAFVNEHEMLGSGFTKVDDYGLAGEAKDIYKNGEYLTAGKIKIYSEKTKEDIQRGKKELSLGYLCEYELSSGEFDGQHYDAIQRNIRVNHVALVDRGRAGSDVRVLDKRTVTYDKLNINLELKEMNKLEKLKDILLRKGVAKDTAEEIAEEIKTQDEEEIKKSEDEDVEVKAKAEDESSEKEDDDKEAEDEEVEAKVEDEDDKKAMDSMAKEIASLRKQISSMAKAQDSMTGDIFKKIAKRDEIANEVSKYVGTFDHSAMTTQDVAKYACKKLSIACDSGMELPTLKGYLSAKKAEATFAMDSKAEKTSDAINEYLK